jgi:hypothetical protein
MLQWLAAGLAEAIVSNKTLSSDDADWPWLAEAGLCSGLGCYFERLAWCPGDAVEEVWAKDLVKRHIRSVGLDEGGRNTIIGILVPPEFRSMGQFWFRSQVLWSLLRLNASRPAELRDARNRSGFGRTGGGIIGVHVRRGDACMASAGKQPDATAACHAQAGAMRDA